MKDRIKKFFKEHVNLAEPLVPYTIGFIAGGIATVLIYRSEGISRVVGVTYGVDDENKIERVRVHLKNGSYQGFHRPPQ